MRISVTLHLLYVRRLQSFEWATSLRSKKKNPAPGQLMKRVSLLRHGCACYERFIHTSDTSLLSPHYNAPSKKSRTIGSWKGVGLNGHFKSKSYLAFKYTFLLLCVSSVVLLLEPAHSHSGTRRSGFPQGHQPKQTTERKCGPHSLTV